VAVFLDLRRQGAAARHVAVAVDQADALFEQGLRQAIPFDCRVAGGELFAQQLAVLDVKQRADQNVGNILKAAIPPLRVFRLVQRLAVTAGQAEAGLVFFVIRQKQAKVGRLRHLAADPGLAVDPPAGLVEPHQIIRQLAVAETHVVRALAGVADAVGWPRPDLPSHFLRGFGEIFCFQGRRQQFPDEQSDQAG